MLICNLLTDNYIKDLGDMHFDYSNQQCNTTILVPASHSCSKVQSMFMLCEQSYLICIFTVEIGKIEAVCVK